MGSGGWWKTVDDITQRRTHSNSALLDNTFANQLNDYFHELCTDMNYQLPPSRVERTGRTVGP